LVFSVALRILENRDDAEEVTLDVYTQVWNQAAAWDSKRGSVTAWLVLLARSRALDRARRRRTAAPLADLDGRTIVSPEQGPEELLAVQERREGVRRILAQLPEAQRLVLDLAFFGGLTQQAISEQLGEPLGTVKWRIRTAMQRLKELLEAEGKGLEGWMQ
jgi:RNA polymerase sigma-70 factor, ECF subfamily